MKKNGTIALGRSACGPPDAVRAAPAGETGRGIASGVGANAVAKIKMQGWLKKRHNGSAFLGGKWAKRWVMINDDYGRLNIGHKPGKEGTTIVRAAHASPCFRLSPGS